MEILSAWASTLSIHLLGFVTWMACSGLRYDADKTTWARDSLHREKEISTLYAGRLSTTVAKDRGRINADSSAISRHGARLAKSSTQRIGKDTRWLRNESEGSRRSEGTFGQRNGDGRRGEAKSSTPSGWIGAHRVATPFCIIVSRPTGIRSLCRRHNDQRTHPLSLLRFSPSRHLGKFMHTGLTRAERHDSDIASGCGCAWRVAAAYYCTVSILFHPIPSNQEAKAVATGSPV